ncbi:MAG TPA: acyl-CoA dehydrogenase family protein, partial [Dehalococcoidia bacterium]|nr:acyl-CoA dehydrogenase family protein [Dehalococcoidia bacterium]
MSRDEILQRAQALFPGFKARAAETEKLRQIPQTTIDELKASGLMRVANPANYGGYGNDADLYFEVAMEIGRACGSTGWCYSVWSSHNWMIGHWPQESQDEYFAGGPDVISSSAFAMLGRLQPVEGGYRLSG